MPIEVVGRSAVISDCGRWRYRLERRLTSGNPLRLGALMVNPSDADHEQDDPTIRRWYGFADRLGYGIVDVANLFAQRTPDVHALDKNPYLASGPENDKHLVAMMNEADLLIVGWGPMSKLHPGLRGRWKDVVKLAAAENKTLYCLGTAKDGHPRHPLMLAADAPLIKWPVPWFVGRPDRYRGDVE